MHSLAIANSLRVTDENLLFKTDLSGQTSFLFNVLTALKRINFYCFIGLSELSGQHVVRIPIQL